MSTALQGRRNEDIKRVRELRARDFHGNANLAEVKNWLTDLERVFAVMMCHDRDRVHLAVFLLKGNEYHWWKVIHRGYVGPTTITWVEFQRIFYE